MSMVRVLGPVDVVADDGSERASGSAMRRTLLALLAIRRGEVLSPDWLMEHMWGDAQPDSGVRALRFHVSKLRQECGESAPIETRPGGYVLDLRADGVDVSVFEELARTARDEPDDLRSVELCERAMGLWRGDAFADAAMCAALDHETARLDELRVSLLERSFVRRLACGAAGELVSELSLLVARFPLRERLWSSLITAQYRAGQQAESLATYERLRSMLAESLGLDPSPELQDLQLRVLRQDPGLDAATASTAPPRPPTAHMLPAMTTSFIEPLDGFDGLLNLIATNRLVTLTGSGGVGKTRTAIELGTRCVNEFTDGVRMVELASVTDAAAVPAAMANELSVKPQPGMSTIESLIEWCRGRDLLLIVDNCEHVVDVLGEVIAAVLAQCPTVSVLATTREPLDLDGECVHRVESLDVVSAIELFVRRATAANSRFADDRIDDEVLGLLCERLDCVPLAIELAAARSRSMSPSEILERLDDRFRLLRRTGRGRHRRHHTLRATVQWSFGLLSDDERLVFERVSVFAGGFDLSAAKSVCVDDVVRSVDVAELLASLVDKSMIIAEPHGGATRYRMLQTIREFGEEQLVAGDGGHDANDRHLDHYVQLAERTDRTLRSPNELAARETFEREWDNVRAAHRWAVTRRDVDRAARLVTAVGLFALDDVREEAFDWVDDTLAIVGDRAPYPYLFGLAAVNEIVEYETALELAKRGIEKAPSPIHPDTALCWSIIADRQRSVTPDLRWSDRAANDPLMMFETAVMGDDPTDDWVALGSLTDKSNPYPRRTPQDVDLVRLHETHVGRLVEAAERVGAPTIHAIAALHVGHLLVDRVPPDVDGALVHYARALATSREVHNWEMIGESLRAIAFATVDRCVDGRAATACRHALEQVRERRGFQRQPNVLESAALVLATLGDVRQASIVLGHLIEHDEAFGREIIFGFRDRSIELVQRDDRSNEWMMSGAASDRDRIMTETIARLAEVTDRTGRDVME